MTWTTPQPVPPTGGGLVPPGPLTLGDIAGGAWRVYKARFGLFLKLLLMPFLIMFGLTVIFALAVTAMVLSNPDSRNAPPAMIGLLVVFYIAMMVASLLLYVYQGRTVVAGIDLATGRAEPTGQNLADRTRGMLGRVVILMLLAFALSIAAIVAFAVVMVPIGLAAGGSGSNSNVGGAGLLGVLLMIVLYVALIWFSIKITYVIPAMAEEKLDAIPAVKRSFQLTKGAFWRTFGYQLVLGLIALAIMLIPYLVLVGVMVSTAAAGNQPSGGVLATLGIVFLLMYAVILLFVPYSYLFTGLMYLGRGRELGGSPTPYPPTAYPPAGAYGAPNPDARAPYPPQNLQHPQQPPYPQQPWSAPPAGGSSPQA